MPDINNNKIIISLNLSNLSPNKNPTSIFLVNNNENKTNNIVSYAIFFMVDFMFIL